MHKGKEILWDDLCVLIIDDSKVARHIVSDMLKKMGINKVFEAEDGQHALEYTDTATDMFDLVVCDWNMPNLDGMEYLKRFRKTNPNQAFLMITGRTDEASVLEAKQAGLDGYLVKPFTFEELQGRVTKILTKKLNPDAET